MDLKAPARPQATSQAERPEAEPGDRRWVALAVIGLAQLLTALDATVVNIALPTAQQDLGFGDAERQWVITAYTVTFAGLLLVGGRVADRVGRKEAFLLGLAGFAASSALAGAAPSFGFLVAGRALQGAFAAIVAPTALSLLVVLFTDRAERGKAFAVYGAIASSGAVVGLIVGGTLTQYASWRWCLYVNVVFALTALAAAVRLVPRVAAYPGTPIPLGSAVLGTSGLVAVVYGASQAADEGWADPEVVVALGLGVVALAAFLALQARLAHPMLPLRLLAGRSRCAAYLAVATAVVGSFGLFLMLTYHFQSVLGWGPLHTGIGFVPVSVAVAGSGYAVSGYLGQRLPARWLVAGGLTVTACGLALMATLTPDSGYLTTMLPAMLLVGSGMGGVFAPAIGIVTAGVDQRDAGIASATANTAMQVGSSLGVALVNTVAVTATRDLLRAGGDLDAALVHGYAVASAATAAALVLVALVVAAVVRSPAGEEPERAEKAVAGLHEEKETS